MEKFYSADKQRASVATACKEQCAGDNTGNKNTLIQFSFKIEATYPIIPVVTVCMRAADPC